MGYVAIFGGTFNPFHIGHYEMLEALQNDQSIDEIWVMPDRIPPHKECDFLASDDDRIEMCRIASKDFNKAKLCLVEFEREGKSYTYDTVVYLKKKYPQNKFLFVCGADMLVYFDKWYKFEELMKLLPFTVFKRTSTDNEEFENSVKTFSSMGMEISVKDEIISNVSSTQFRKENLREILPENIYNYIKERGIYNV